MAHTTITSSPRRHTKNVKVLKKAARALSLTRGLIVMAALSAITLFAVLQFPQVRNFFSKADGEPAHIRVDTTAVLGPMPRPWRYLAQGGEDHNWRMGGITDQVKALKPEYIRIDHLYDFHDIVGGTPGNLTFNFSKLDGLLDDIAATGAKPYISVSYMPPVISQGDIVDKPQRWEDWQLVVQKTVEHISGKRGTSDVYYEIWNEPDLFGGWKYYGDKNYLDLYGYAARGAANARGVKPYKIGGAATTALYKNWFTALLNYADDNKMRLDFFSWHRYDNDVDQYRRDMLELRTWLRDFPQYEPTLELHITEWGHESDIDAGYDTNYGAAHTVAGAIEMVGVIEKAFTFEIQDGKDPAGQAAWGRWGLLQHADFGSKAKPRYYALRLLDRIGSQRLQLLGKGSWVKGLAARNDDQSVSLILANYDLKGSHTELVPVTFENIVPGSFTITQEPLSGPKKVENVATTSSQLRINVPMTANSVILLNLKQQAQ